MGRKTARAWRAAWNRYNKSAASEIRAGVYVGWRRKQSSSAVRVCWVLAVVVLVEDVVRRPGVDRAAMCNSAAVKGTKTRLRRRINSDINAMADKQDRRGKRTVFQRAAKADGRSLKCCWSSSMNSRQRYKLSALGIVELCVCFVICLLSNWLSAETDEGRRAREITSSSLWLVVGLGRGTHRIVSPPGVSCITLISLDRASRTLNSHKRLDSSPP